MTKSKTVVTISRHWHRPEITSTVCPAKISLSMPLTDYLDALTQELWAQGRWLTQAQLTEKVRLAGQILEQKFKEESAKVV